jgi:hypothetical protein
MKLYRKKFETTLDDIYYRYAYKDIDISEYDINNLFASVHEDYDELILKIIKDKTNSLALLNIRHTFLPIRELCEWKMKDIKIEIVNKI